MRLNGLVTDTRITKAETERVRERERKFELLLETLNKRIIEKYFHRGFIIFQRDNNARLNVFTVIGQLCDVEFSCGKLIRHDQQRTICNHKYLPACRIICGFERSSRIA